MPQAMGLQLPVAYALGPSSLVGVGQACQPAEIRTMALLIFASF